MADKTRDDLSYMARLAEQAERYDDMVREMKAIVVMDPNLSSEERNLLSVAYKNVIGARRSSWRIVNSLQNQQETPMKREVLVSYRDKIEQELFDSCNEVLKLLDSHLIPSSAGEAKVESRVFYYKMKGDYYRYLAEVCQDEKKKEPKDMALQAYEQAVKDACDNEGLHTTHPIRLGLALNFSVFYYEIMMKQDKACEVAKKAFDDAISDLDSMKQDTYKDSTLILQLIRDNLTLWTSENESEDPGRLEDVDQQEA